MKSPLVDERRSLMLPAPTVMARGIGNVFISQAWLEESSMECTCGDLSARRGAWRADCPAAEAHAAARDAIAAPKPAYRVPSMAEINAVPWNGLTHVGTFSGGGGTSIGFRLAGFKTVWANDCDPHARECYRANLGSPIDGQDIRAVGAQTILGATGLAAGELDVFEGSPPCTAFSTAGKRAKGWGRRKEHAGIVQDGVEDLFFEWLRLLEGLRPRAFVAENVSGMVKGVSKGYFKEVLRRMKALGYRSEARLLDAQWLGVPQQRQRVIFVGVRDDLGLAPAFPSPLPYRYSVREAIPWLSAGAIECANGFNGHAPTGTVDEPFATVQAGRAVRVEQIVGNDRFKPKFGTLDRPHPTIMSGGAHGGSGEIRVVHDTGGFVRGEEITDRPCPTVGIGGAGAVCSTHFLVEGQAPADEQTRVTRRTMPGEVARRKFTIAELRRVCSFPDDYRMGGSYAEQWARLGNSVPPLMAHAIACAIRDRLKER